MSNQLHAVETSIYTATLVRGNLLKLIAEIESQLKACLKEVESAINANAEWSRKVAQICLIKGVGVLTVAQVIAETNEFALFENQPVRPLGLRAGNIPGFGSLPAANQSGVH